MRKFYFLLLMILCFGTIHAQDPNDCVNAITVNGNATFASDVSTGMGQLQEVSSCGGREINSLWLKVVIAQSGTLGFDLKPNNPAIAVDYDFYVFGSNKNCDSLGSPIRCATTNPQAAGMTTNQTGMIKDTLNTAVGPGANGSGYVRSLSVVAGEFYYIVIDGMIGDGGFDIEWTGTAVIGSAVCQPPVQITHKEVTQSSAVFSWDNPNGVTQWEYLALPKSMGYPKGTETVTTTTTIVDNQVTGLLLGTQYNFYVRSVCNGVPGVWSTAHLFSTLCDASALTATISGSTTVCADSTAPITITGTPNATVNYNVNNGANQSIILDDFGTAILTTSSLTTTTTYALQGIFFSTCSKILSGSAVVAVLETAKANSIPEYSITDTPYDGIAVFDLTSKSAAILGDQTNFSITYYATQMDANAGVNPISNPSSYTNFSNPQTIYARVSSHENTTTCYAVTSFSIWVLNADIIYIPDANFKAKLLAFDPNNVIDANHNGEIEVNEAIKIEYLNLDNAGIKDMTGIENFTNLFSLYCNYNSFITLDVSKLPKLCILHCNNNSNLQSIFVKNGSSFCVFESDFNNTPNLVYVCANEKNVNNFNVFFSNNGIKGVNVNSYCSFVSGGVFYNIQGITSLDIDNNGCDENDNVFKNLKFNITNGAINGSLISDLSGNYSIPVQAGASTITPMLENPSYFNVYPTTLNVTFPTETSPFTQDFCITPNSVHQDLEITLLPIGVARPGFDSKYKIIYRNKGNQTQSGVINLSFDDTVLDFIVANPTINNQQPSSLKWDFTNLSPFETGEITFTMNVNSPVETPAVNNGDFLNFNATISSSNTDETPNDNIFAFHQTVVGSYDPNDKTCLEGDTITPEMIGSDVHYLIRFENTGSYHAENIVVKDMIDTTKFDISTLVPVRGSHEFVTKISEGNKVEFIFENINLPFDDANNDGFVTFKIKTKPTLTLGDSFSNTASIYFDYNAPIVTNTTNTTIAVLGKQDFEFSNYFSLYPNPVSTTIHLNVKKEIEVKSVNIYNTLGQLVLVIPNAQQVKTVNVSSLSLGNYFIKLNTDKGNVTEQFIKK